MLKLNHGLLHKHSWVKYCSADKSELATKPKKTTAPQKHSVLSLQESMPQWQTIDEYWTLYWNDAETWKLRTLVSFALSNLCTLDFILRWLVNALQTVFFMESIVDACHPDEWWQVLCLFSHSLLFSPNEKIQCNRKQNRRFCPSMKSGTYLSASCMAALERRVNLELFFSRLKICGRDSFNCPSFLSDNYASRTELSIFGKGAAFPWQVRRKILSFQELFESLFWLG